MELLQSDISEGFLVFCQDPAMPDTAICGTLREARSMVEEMEEEGCGYSHVIFQINEVQ